MPKGADFWVTDVVGNLFEPFRALLQASVDAGFIQAENLSLVTILDLPGGVEANTKDESANEWGAATVKALKEWSLEVSPQLQTFSPFPV